MYQRASQASAPKFAPFTTRPPSDGPVISHSTQRDLAARPEAYRSCFLRRLEGGQRPWSGTGRERLVDPFDLSGGQLEVAGSRVLRRVLGFRGLRNREYWRVPHEEGQRDLARRRIVRRGDLRQHSSTCRARSGKVALAEGAVADDGDVVLLAPRQHLVL